MPGQQAEAGLDIGAGGACGQQVSARGHSQRNRMTLASMMTRAPRLTPAPPTRRAAAPGRQAPSWPQRHTVTFRGCSRCWGGCPESRSSRLRRCRPSWTWWRSRRRAWLTAGSAQGQQGAPGQTSSHPIPNLSFQCPSMPFAVGRGSRDPGPPFPHLPTGSEHSRPA